MPQPAVTTCVLGSSPTPAVQGAQHRPEGHQIKRVSVQKASVGMTEAHHNGYMVFRSSATSHKQSLLPTKRSSDQAWDMGEQLSGVRL